MKFKAYSDEEVKNKLNMLFGFKCAYCEGDFGAMMPVDVEHFRPKGGVIDATGTLRFPGYWWLASKWENLLPSCIDCNRTRWQKVGTSKYKRGKENLFPLLGGAPPAVDEAGVNGEQPLLLNPTEDQPSRHIQHVYIELPGGRKESIVQPVVDAGGTEDPKGRASIDTYGLNRDRLVVSRLRTIERMIAAIDNVETFFQVADAEADPAKAALLRSKGRLAIKRLAKNFLHWRNPYSAACRAYYRSWLETL
ncbi:hypothetical protein SCD90_08745 [Terrihabitans sp. PJ23]|uniref:HNH endonuclease n=2 Tax=Terrihabitans rhizophilus TaxID=3092662 RepID=A0ABU4RMU0_9HYPH|nr:hypothetical protein [Terrihabitans sp. PJ23]